MDGDGIGNGRGVRTSDTDRRGAPRRAFFLHGLRLVALANIAGLAKIVSGLNFRKDTSKPQALGLEPLRRGQG